MGCAPAKKVESKEVKAGDKNDKKQKNFDEVFEDIMDIKIVNLKGDMLFSETNGKPKDHYDVLENIASGTLGLVKKVKNKFSQCIRAMKVIKKAFIDLQEDEKNFMKEIAILRTLVRDILKKDHPNILKIYEFYQDEKCFYLISEFCNDGDLFDKLSKKSYFDENCSAHMMKQLLSALLYCHQHNIVHRDIKAENILIESSEIVGDKELYNIRLTDFSSARSFSKSKKLTKKVGTPYYIAPEVLKRSYNEKCDVWSCGVLLFIFLCGKPPFFGDTDKEILEQVDKGKPYKKAEEWSHISKEAQNLIDKMLTYEPSKRFSIQECLKHPWFEKCGRKYELNIQHLKNFHTNIVTFKVDQTFFFQQAILSYMIHHLAVKDDTEEIRQLFYFIDKNNDGKLQFDEFVEGFKVVNQKEKDKDMIKVLKFIDQGKVGFLEYEEFLSICIDRPNFLNDEKLKIAFGLFDKDGSGSISPQELKSLLGLSSKFTAKTWEWIIKTIDQNGDGQIEYSEFKEMMDKFISA